MGSSKAAALTLLTIKLYSCQHQKYFSLFPSIDFVHNADDDFKKAAFWDIIGLFACVLTLACKSEGILRYIEIALGCTGDGNQAFMQSGLCMDGMIISSNLLGTELLTSGKPCPSKLAQLFKIAQIRNN